MDYIVNTGKSGETCKPCEKERRQTERQRGTERERENTYIQ